MIGEERGEKWITRSTCVRTFRACRVWFALSRTRKTFPKLPVVAYRSEDDEDCSRVRHKKQQHAIVI